MSAPQPALSHPHIFIDGTVDFRFGPDAQLSALEVSWTYDAFETLYMLAQNEMGLNSDGTLDAADRRVLVKRLSQWPDDFDGSVHVTRAGAKIPLAWPRDLELQVSQGRLHLRFVRPLPEPLDPSGKTIEVAMFESTYFFDFTLINTPQLSGPAPNCAIKAQAYDPNFSDNDLRDMLAKLGREETSDIPNVGSYFADKVVLTCD